MFTTNQYPSPADAAVGVAQWIVAQGGYSRPRGMPAVECLFIDLMVLSPEMIPFTIEKRGLNPRYAALEICSLLGGMPVDSHQRFTAKGFAVYQNGNVQRGNYGVRIRTQLRDFVAKLVDDPMSRQAVMTIFDGNRDLIDDSLDVPCTLALQGFVRDGNFYLGTHMRSNDAFLGLPYDLMQFCALQCTIAEVLGVNYGFYRHSVGSMHVYAADLDRVTEMSVPESEAPCQSPLWSPGEMNEHDPLDNLAYVTAFCQDALYGQTALPKTDFEHWIVESL